MRGKRPTLRQKQIIADNGFDPEMWLIQKVYSDSIICKHRYTDQQKEFYAEPVRI